MTASAAKIFTLVFGIVYCICFYMGWYLFLFYPETGAFSLQPRPDDGPSIQWYGWMAIAAIVSGGLALVVPRSIGDRISPGLVWGISVGTIAVIMIYERRWFV